ncbi:MAG: carbohydrate ABC transporter permease [[Clostridium] leptum]
MSQRVKKKASPMARQEAVAGYVFILPTILLYLCLTIIPIIVTFSLSFMDYDLVKPSTFIGFDNYIKLFQDSRLGQVALNTVLFALMSVVGNVGIGLLLAVILNRKMPKFFVNFFRFSFFLPVVIGYVYVSIVWSNLYSTDTGVFNYFLSLLGLEKVGWLTNKSIVLFSIILMDIWKNAGFFMVIFLAGLQNIPAQYYEAAQTTRQPVPAVPPYYASASEPHHVFQCDLVLDQCFAGVRRRVYLDPRRPGRRFQKHCGIYL